MMAQWGFFLIFHTGIKLDPKELLEYIWPNPLVAPGGFILPFALGLFTGRMFVELSTSHFL